MKKLLVVDSLKFVRAMFVALAAAFILNVAHAATLPAGYTELEYLESTGTQWIDTGYILQSNDVTYEWTAEDLSTATNTSLFGSEQTENPKYSGILYGNKTSRKLFAGNSSVVVTYSSGSGFHDWVLSLTNDHNATLYKDGTLVSNVSFNGNLQKSISIGVFSNHKNTSDQYAQMRLKKFVIKDNNAVAVNLIPARRDSDGVVGMYDLADSNPETAFHTNAGTGEFIAGEYQIKIATTKYNEAKFAPVETRLDAAVAAVDTVVSQTMTQAQAIDTIATTKQTRPNEGCTVKYCLLVEGEDGTPHWYPIAGANGVEYVLPSGYTQLEYIQSDGESYLIVPYRVNNKTVFYARYNEIQKGQQSNASAVFGVTSTPDTSKANYGIVRLLDGTGRFNRMGWGNNLTGSVIDVDAPKNLNTWYEVLYDQNKLYQDNVLYATSATPNDTEWVANYDLGIFARNSATVTMPAVAKISSVWAKEDGVYKINLIPARRDSDGMLGMYDLADSNPATAFYTNEGTGEFTAGPDM